MLVFVYGTLTDPEQVDALLDGWTFVGDAVLDGLDSVDGAYPTLVPGDGVEGRLLRTGEVDRLDAYEGVDRGLYVRVVVPLARPGDEGNPTDDDEVAVYVGDPGRLDVPDDWPGEGPFGGRVRDFVTSNDVVVRPAGDRQD